MKLLSITLILIYPIQLQTLMILRIQYFTTRVYMLKVITEQDCYRESRIDLK